mgnify:CR=1 FL=1
MQRLPDAARSLGVPLAGVHHMEGHLFATSLDDADAEPPFTALLVSGDTDPNVVETAARNGCLVLRKPVEPMALRAGLSRLLEPAKLVAVTAGDARG